MSRVIKADSQRDAKPCVTSRALHSRIRDICSLVHNVVLLCLNSALISPIVAHVTKMDGYSCSEDKLLELFQRLEHFSDVNSPT